MLCPRLASPALAVAVGSDRRSHRRWHDHVNNSRFDSCSGVFHAHQAQNVAPKPHRSNATSRYCRNRSNSGLWHSFSVIRNRLSDRQRCPSRIRDSRACSHYLRRRRCARNSAQTRRSPQGLVIPSSRATTKFGRNFAATRRDGANFSHFFVTRRSSNRLQFAPRASNWEKLAPVATASGSVNRPQYGSGTSLAS